MKWAEESAPKLKDACYFKYLLGNFHEVINEPIQIFINCWLDVKKWRMNLV